MSCAITTDIFDISENVMPLRRSHLAETARRFVTGELGTIYEPTTTKLLCRPTLPSQLHLTIVLPKT